MRWGILFVILAPSSLLATAPSITPSTPTVNQGLTIQFSETAVEAGSWTCTGTTSTGGVTACAGSINKGNGLYTAPSTITPQHWWGGVQVGPNNDVYNVRIDSLPINSNNASWIAAVNGIGGSPSLVTDFPIQYVNSANTDLMNFTYTSLNNGTFEIPTFPLAMAENGWFDALENGSSDHHVIMVDSNTSTFSEFYQYYPNCVTTAATVASNVATLTCSKNPILQGFVAGTTITVSGFSGADTYFNISSAAVTTVTTTSISYGLQHGNGTASTNGAAGKGFNDGASDGLRNAQSGIKYAAMDYLLPLNATTDAAGMELQPCLVGLQEFEQAVQNNDYIHHAVRATFALGALASSNIWPATTFATDGQTVPFGARMRLKGSFNMAGYTLVQKVILKTLQYEGMFVTDGGIQYDFNAERTRWPKAYFDDIQTLNGSSVIASSMEFVDESGIIVSTASSLTTYNRETIVFTRTSDASSATVDIALNGPAVNFGQDSLYIIAGTPAYQIPVYNNYGGFTCAAASTGTLTSGCVYTPPASVNAATSTVVQVTSSVNASVSAWMTLTVYPSTGIYVIPSQTSDYVDTGSHTWVNRSGLTDQPDYQGCCACDNQGNFSGTDVTLFNCVVGGISLYSGDTKMNFVVPNGTYKLTYNYGSQFAVGAQALRLSVNNVDLYDSIDPAAQAGGQYKNFTTTDVVVTNNLVNFGIWAVDHNGAPVSSLSIVQIAAAAASAASRTITGGGVLFGKGSLQ